MNVYTYIICTYWFNAVAFLKLIILLVMWTLLISMGGCFRPKSILLFSSLKWLTLSWLNLSKNIYKYVYTFKTYWNAFYLYSLKYHLFYILLANVSIAKFWYYVMFGFETWSWNAKNQFTQKMFGTLYVRHNEER